MLVNFTVKNLLSFKEEQTLSLQTGAYLRKYVNNRFEVKPKNYPEKLRLLKSAIVLGKWFRKIKFSEWVKCIKNISFKRTSFD